MEIVSFLKMWMDVWNEAEEKGLKMPEEAGTFQKKETKHDEVMKEIIKFLPRREFSAENGKMAVDSLEKAVSQKNLMSILEKGQNAGENISFIEERKKKIAANMEVIGKRIQESRLGKAEESFWMAQTERPVKMPEEMAGTGMEKWEKPCFRQFLRQMVQKEKFCGCCGNGRRKKVCRKHPSRFLFPLGRCGKAPM